jgi:hypothetical protein
MRFIARSVEPLPLSVNRFLTISTQRSIVQRNGQIFYSAGTAYTAVTASELLCLVRLYPKIALVYDDRFMRDLPSAATWLEALHS